MSNALDQLASRLERNERNIKALSTPQLAHSSVEGGGAIDVNDGDGQTVMALGGQFDGTFVAATLVGPKPPTPTTPILEPAPGAIIVRWDGAFLDGAVAPMDFARVEVHASTTQGFDASSAATLRATIETARGNEAALILPAGVKHYVKLVARSLAGKAGDASGEAAETPATVGVEQSVIDAIDAKAQAAQAAATGAQTAADTAQAAADQAKADAATVSSEVDGIPAQIAAAKSEAIDTSATTAQAKADAAKQAAIDAAALTAQAKADTAKAEALTAAAVTAQQKADAAAATAQAAAISAAATDAQNKADLAKAAAINAAATDAQTKADAAKTAAISAAALTAQQKADLAQATALADSKAWASSRGTDLVTNGTGYLGNNTNFTGFDFDPLDAPIGATGSFDNKNLLIQGIVYTDEAISIDPKKSYKASISIKQKDANTTARSYLGVSFRDVDGNVFGWQNCQRVPGTDTTLAQPLKAGDTKVYLTSVAAWRGQDTAFTPYSQYLVFYDYTNSKGYKWPAYTFSRNVWANPTVANGTIASVNTADNTLTLVAPYSGPDKPAGLAIAEGVGGDLAGRYFASNVLATSTWTAYSGVFSGPQTTHTPGPTQFPYGTASVRLFGTYNYNRTDTTTPSRIGFAAWSLSDAAAAQATADATAGLTAGWTKTGTTQIDGGAIYADSVTAAQIAANAITASEIATDAVIAAKIQAGAVIAGKLATDSVLANNVKAGAITTTKLAVGDMSNMATINEVESGETIFDSIHTVVAGWSTRSVLTSTYQMFRPQLGPVPFATGDRIRVTFEAYADAAVTANVYLWLYGDANVGELIGPATITTTPQKFALELTVATATALKTSYIIGMMGVANRDVRLRNVRAHRMGAGELVVDGTIVASKIATDAITAAKVQANAIIAGKIATDAVLANNIKAGEVVAGKLAADAVLATNIAADAVLARNIKAGEITAAKMATGTITAASGVIGDIDAAKITVGKITAAQMATGTITAASGVIGSLDASKITTGTLDAGVVTVANLSAARIVSGTLDAARIATASLSADKLATGELSAGQRIIAGPTAGTHAEMTSSGFKVFAEDLVDLVPNEVVRMGASDTNDLFGVTDADGVMKASISETGFGSFSGLSVDGTDSDGDGTPDSGLVVYGTDFKDWMWNLPRGVVAAFTHDQKSQAGIVGRVSLGELSFTPVPGRRYRITVSGLQAASTVIDDRALLSLRATRDDSTPQVGSAVLESSVSPPFRTAGSVFTIPPMVFSQVFGPPIASNGASLATDWTPTGPLGLVRILLCLERYTGTGSISYNTQYGGTQFKPLRWEIEDVGPDCGDVYWWHDGGSGGTASSAGTKKTYTTTWTSTSSGTYKGDGTKRSDTSDVVQGYNSSNGDGKGLWVFPSMTTALAGSSISKVEVYAYANHWYYNSGGTALINVHGYSAAPASSPSMTTAVSSASWPKPGGRWVTLPSTFHAGFLNGTYKGFGVGPAGGTNLLYYGRFNGGAGAKIRITYTK